MALVLDSGAVTQIAKRSRDTAVQIAAWSRAGLWPPIVPSTVLIACVTGEGSRDAVTNRLLNTCDVVEELSEGRARRAAWLRTMAQRGSAGDALVVASADRLAPSSPGILTICERWPLMREA